MLAAASEYVNKSFTCCWNPQQWLLCALYGTRYAAYISDYIIYTEYMKCLWNRKKYQWISHETER